MEAHVYVCMSMCLHSALRLCVLCLLLQHHPTYSTDSWWVRGFADRPLSALCLLVCIHQGCDRELWICLFHSDLLKWYTLTVCSWNRFLDCILKEGHFAAWELWRNYWRNVTIECCMSPDCEHWVVCSVGHEKLHLSLIITLLIQIKGFLFHI